MIKSQKVHKEESREREEEEQLKMITAFGFGACQFSVQVARKMQKKKEKKTMEPDAFTIMSVELC